MLFNCVKRDSRIWRGLLKIKVLLYGVSRKYHTIMNLSGIKTNQQTNRNGKEMPCLKKLWTKWLKYLPLQWINLNIPRSCLSWIGHPWSLSLSEPYSLNSRVTSALHSIWQINAMKVMQSWWVRAPFHEDSLRVMGPWVTGLAFPCMQVLANWICSS